ncbi:MAG: L-alanine exporter AlaE, partial [Desulfobacteraceae bacterium]
MKNIPESMIRSLQSRTVADTFAMVTFAFAVGMIVEVVFSGLTLDQSFQSRLLAIPMNMIIARP